MPAILSSGLHGRRLGAELSEPLGQRLREAWLGTPWLRAETRRGGGEAARVIRSRTKAGSIYKSEVEGGSRGFFKGACASLRPIRAASRPRGTPHWCQ